MLPNLTAVMQVTVCSTEQKIPAMSVINCIWVYEILWERLSLQAQKSV